jgi:hypothetical protein
MQARAMLKTASAHVGTSHASTQELVQAALRSTYIGRATSREPERSAEYADQKPPEPPQVRESTTLTYRRAVHAICTVYAGESTTQPPLRSSAAPLEYRTLYRCAFRGMEQPRSTPSGITVLTVLERMNLHLPSPAFRPFARAPPFQTR